MSSLLQEQALMALAKKGSFFNQNTLTVHLYLYAVEVIFWPWLFDISTTAIVLKLQGFGLEFI